MYRGYTDRVKSGKASSACRVPEAVFRAVLGFEYGQPRAKRRNMGCRIMGSLALPSAAASLFFTFFPADCRICGSPLIEVSRLPVCESCLIALRPLQGSYCSVCGEALHIPATLIGERDGSRREDR